MITGGKVDKSLAERMLKMMKEQLDQASVESNSKRIAALEVSVKNWEKIVNGETPVAVAPVKRNPSRVRHRKMDAEDMKAFYKPYHHS